MSTMSLANSSAELTALIDYTSELFEGWQATCADYTDITGTLHCLLSVLRRLKPYVDIRAAARELCHPFWSSGLQEGTLVGAIDECNRSVTGMDAVLTNLDRLEASASSNWNRIKSRTKDIRHERLKLQQALSTILGLLMGLDLQQLHEAYHDGGAQSLPSPVREKARASLVDQHPTQSAVSPTSRDTASTVPKHDGNRVTTNVKYQACVESDDESCDGEQSQCITPRASKQNADAAFGVGNLGKTPETTQSPLLVLWSITNNTATTRMLRPKPGSLQWYWNSQHE